MHALYVLQWYWATPLRVVRQQRQIWLRGGNGLSQLSIFLKSCLRTLSSDPKVFLYSNPGELTKQIPRKNSDWIIAAIIASSSESASFRVRALKCGSSKHIATIYPKWIATIVKKAEKVFRSYTSIQKFVESNEHIATNVLDCWYWR